MTNPDQDEIIEIEDVTAGPDKDRVKTYIRAGIIAMMLIFLFVLFQQLAVLLDMS